MVIDILIFPILCWQRHLQGTAQQRWYLYFDVWMVGKCVTGNSVCFCLYFHSAKTVSTISTQGSLNWGWQVIVTQRNVTIVPINVSIQEANTGLLNIKLRLYSGHYTTTDMCNEADKFKKALVAHFQVHFKNPL